MIDLNDVYQLVAFEYKTLNEDETVYDFDDYTLENISEVLLNTIKEDFPSDVEIWESQEIIDILYNLFTQY